MTKERPRLWCYLIAAGILLFTAYVAAYFAVSKQLGAPGPTGVTTTARLFNGRNAYVIFTPLRRIESAATGHTTHHSDVPIGEWMRHD